MEIGLDHLATSPRDARGKTPLHVACDQNKGDLALLLLGSGADAGIPDGRGRMPLDGLVAGVKRTLFPYAP